MIGTEAVKLNNGGIANRLQNVFVFHKKFPILFDVLMLRKIFYVSN